jgi:hypothetical protein
MQVSGRKDLLFNDTLVRYREEENESLREAYLYAILKYVKMDLKASGTLFSKALIEKVYDRVTEKFSFDEDYSVSLYVKEAKLCSYAAASVNSSKVETL